MKKRLLIIVFCTMLFNFLLAQSHVEMADAMRSDGKIYVVVAVACVVFTIITIYLITVDRKVSRLEKSTKK
jgi:hypothetical protein